MLSNRVLFGLFCLVAVGCNGLPDGNRLSNGKAKGHAEVETAGMARVSEEPEGAARQVALDPSMAVVQAAQAEIGVREVGENRGPRVDGYNRYAGVINAPWCASFVSYCFGQAGFAQPRTAWSPALFPGKRQIKYAPSGLENSGFAETVRGLWGGTEFAASRYRGAGLVLGIYYPSKGRIAHCGIVTELRGDWVYSVEGNTNGGGGREGDGVYARKRHRRTIFRFADWIEREGSRILIFRNNFLIYFKINHLSKPIKII